jgi:hypothetical protein
MWVLFWDVTQSLAIIRCAEDTSHSFQNSLKSLENENKVPSKRREQLVQLHSVATKKIEIFN